ncbi:MAG: inner membrane CreD family protein [Bryobacteraceae bacterium]|nr:inner membrane CreD family protein [Bryobacteraceae bacterium]
MVKHLIAILAIYVCAAMAWFVLGGTLFNRTAMQDGRLRGKVASMWGGEQAQRAPWACLKTPGEEAGKFKTAAIALVQTRAEARLELDRRRKGLLWYNTFGVRFGGTYVFENNRKEAGRVELRFPLPAEKAVYDDIVFLVNGAQVEYGNSGGRLTAEMDAQPGERITLHAGYRSQGMDRWSYKFGGGVEQVRDFVLKAHTSFSDVDFADNTLPPSAKQQRDGGWDLEWRYRNLLTGSNIAVAMPEALQPGPLAAEISFFAPVSLLFFFFVMLLFTAMKGIELHAVNYFFLAAAFFSFHLLLAYLVDHVSLAAAFVICSMVSVFLVISYLRLVVGMRFAAVEAGLAQLVYLVLFSAAFFLKGFTGLTVTVGAIATLFVAMQMTGRIRWAERFDYRMTPGR